MSNALTDIEAFLGAIHPFEVLDAARRRQAAAAIEAVYRRKGTVLLQIGQQNDALHIVRRGAVEAHDAAGELVGRYGEGESYGVQSLLTGRPVRFRVSLIEDGLIWSLPRGAFESLREASPEFGTYFLRSLEERLKLAMRPIASEGETLFMTPLGELVRRGPVVVPPATSIAAAARTMSSEHISSLLVGEGDELHGIVTDRDLRIRVVAEGMDTAAPVTAIMTAPPLTLDAGQPVLEGILAMAARGIHHLPLTRAGRVIGMVTTRDLLSLQTQHPLYLAARIQKADSVPSLVETCRRIPKLFQLMLSSGMRPEQVPKILTTISDAVTRRLLNIAQSELGRPPAPFAWLVFGSQARQEQSLKTDQDNGLVYADDAPQGSDDYFAALAHIVCDGLNDCGYVHCPGGIMATTQDWRQPLSGWLRRFAAWSMLPDPEAVLRVSIFFDLRAMYGDRELGQRLAQALVESGSGSGKGIFLATLARQAAHYDVPLGFFRRFVLQDKGDHREALEIKASGLMPLTDLVRVRALQAGIAEPATQQRLALLLEQDALSRRDVDRLEGAHRLLSGLRVRLHAEQVRRGEAPNNWLDPRAITHAERAALRDAFLVIREAQKRLAADFSL